MKASVLCHPHSLYVLQVKTMHNAAALVCVHGADCMNLMFLPPRGTVVEIDPVHYGASRGHHLRSCSMAAWQADAINHALRSSGMFVPGQA